MVDLGVGCGSRCRVDDDRGIEGICGESVVCSARCRLHVSGIVAPLFFCDKILKLPTMILHRSLAEDQHDFQFPEIPFIPRSFSSRSQSPQRSEVCVGAAEVAGGFGVSGCFWGKLGEKCIF